MITFTNVSLRRGARLLLHHLTWTIYPNQCIGLIGSNGSGKSSLFAMILQQLEPDSGDFFVSSKVTIAHAEQELIGTEQSALQYVLDGDRELRQLEADLKKAEDAHDGLKIGAVHDQLLSIDAYTAPSRAAQLLSGLGFSEEEQQQSIDSFSGGWRVRLSLAKALMCRSDVLLLDEPTNHLDLDAVIWLEEWLKQYQGTLLIISHDRDFLDHVVTHIAHLHQQEMHFYTGNYSQFETERANQLMLQQTAYEKQQKQIVHMQRFIDRFKAKASKARQAQSREKALARLDLVCAVQTESPFNFSFREPDSCPNPLLSLEHVNLGYETKVVLKNISYSLGPKDRIGVLGPNGAGKSTLIKCFAGVLAPQHGVIEKSSGLRIGYFAQHQVDQLNLTESPIQHLREMARNASETELRTFLGSFDFRGDMVFSPIEKFSGGEKSRLALALIVWQKPNLLLLDEPTNHLDLEMRQALSLALQEYSGAMLLVSHDRFLVRTTTDQLLLVADHHIEEFSGDLTDYEKWLQNYRRRDIKLRQAGSKNKVVDKKVDFRQIEKKISQIEIEITLTENKIAELSLLLNDPFYYEAQQKTILAQKLESHAAYKKELMILEENWLLLCQQRDKEA